MPGTTGSRHRRYHSQNGCLREAPRFADGQFSLTEAVLAVDYPGRNRPDFARIAVRPEHLIIWSAMP